MSVMNTLRKIRPHSWIALGLALAACGSPRDNSSSSKEKPDEAQEESAQTIAGRYISAIDRGQLVGAKGDLKALSTALEQYAVSEGQYPQAEDFEALIAVISPTYISMPAQRDSWGGLIRASSTPDGYTLSTPGPDKRPGTADDVVMENGTFTNLPEGFQ